MTNLPPIRNSSEDDNFSNNTPVIAIIFMIGITVALGVVAYVALNSLSEKAVEYEHLYISGEITDISYSIGFGRSITILTINNTRAYPIDGTHAYFEIGREYNIHLKYVGNRPQLYYLVDYEEIE